MTSDPTLDATASHDLYSSQAILGYVEEQAMRRQTRNDRRPIEDHPRMSPRTCYPSTLVLTVLYSEPEKRAGTLRLMLHGSVCFIPPAWNVKPDRRIVDATFIAPVDASDVPYVDNRSGSDRDARAAR